MRSVDVDVLRQLLSYEPLSGDLFWLPRPQSMFKSYQAFYGWNGRFVGKKALVSTMMCGYKYGGILGVRFLAHRVAWALATGSWPPECMDHINGDRADNRLANLRCVSQGENLRNSSRPHTNTSGTVGVRWVARDKRWIATIGVKGRMVHLGSFLSIEAAIAARKDADQKYGFHQNHGKHRRDYPLRPVAELTPQG